MDSKKEIVPNWKEEHFFGFKRAPVSHASKPSLPTNIYLLYMLSWRKRNLWKLRKWFWGASVCAIVQTDTPQNHFPLRVRNLWCVEHVAHYVYMAAAPAFLLRALYCSRCPNRSRNLQCAAPCPTSSPAPCRCLFACLSENFGRPSQWEKRGHRRYSFMWIFFYDIMLKEKKLTFRSVTGVSQTLK